MGENGLHIRLALVGDDGRHPIAAVEEGDSVGEKARQSKNTPLIKKGKFQEEVSESQFFQVSG